MDIIATPETMLLGIALTQPKALDDIEHLTPDHFEDPDASAIWATITRLAQQGKPHNPATVSALGDHDRELLTDLAYSAPLGATADYYADLVEKNAVRRRLQIAGGQLAQLATDTGLEDIPATIETARKIVDDATALTGTVTAINAGQHFAEYLDSLGKPVELTPTPWIDLDNLIGGWRPGALYVIGARPGAGKTLVGLQAAVALQQHGKVLFSSLEMTRDEIQNRLIAQVASVALKTFETSMEDQHWQRITNHSERLANMNIEIDDRGTVTPTDIRSVARTITRRGKLAGIVVDYLQLMSAPRGDKRPRHEVVADYSRRLKLLAKELHVPVIALSQLNRESTQRGDGKPRVSDLRESGAVEQDADVIILLHRDDNNLATLNVGVGKNRHGATGNFQLNFEGHYARATQHRWSPA